MTPRQRRQIASILKELEAATLHAGRRRLEPNRTDDAKVGDDQDEQPLNEMLQAIASNRNANDSQLLARIRAAQRKLAERPEDFGLCEDCEEQIPAPRLQKMPFAERCVNCQAKHDPQSRPTRTKLTDYR